MHDDKVKDINIKIHSDGTIQVGETYNIVCDYKWETKEDIIKAVSNYINNYVSTELYG